MSDYIHRAKLGALANLYIEANRLHVLKCLDRCPEILESIGVLREQMESLPEQGMNDKMFHWWNIKEAILTTGAEASTLLGAYEQALEFNAEVLSSMKARGATSLELARSAFKDYFPLLRLGHNLQAGELILDCKKVFERENDTKSLGNFFCSLADLERQQGQIGKAIELFDTSLRYSYQAEDFINISTNHHNLAISQREVGSDKALAHRLAAGIIRYQIGSGLLASTIQEMVIDLAKFGAQALPTNFRDLCQTVDEIEGVNFRELFLKLTMGSNANGDQVMLKIIDMAKKKPFLMRRL
jgi:tetratricopeptide (TPR) repeat protein